MRFKVFAKKLNRVICGKSNVQQFTRALFEYMIQDDVCVLLDDIKPDIFKLYYSEKYRNFGYCGYRFSAP